MIQDGAETVETARDEASSRAVAVCDRPVRAALRGLCPRCGQGRLFDGFLKVRPQTSHSGRTFIMQIAGFVAVFSALVVEINFHPPMWLHLIVWLPMTAGLSLALMRPGRGLMIGLQYRNQVDRSSSVPPLAEDRP